MISLGDLLKKDLPTLALFFFNARPTLHGDFEIVGDWRTQLAVTGDRKYEAAAKALSSKYGIQFEQVSNTRVAALVENNLGVSLGEALQYVYTKLTARIVGLTSDFELDLEIALALFMLRGSPDTNHHFYAVDFKLPSDRTDAYVENTLKLLMSTEDLFSRLNLNFRNLQPQFVAGTNLRNTQIRINLRWFDNMTRQALSVLNPYKFEVLANNEARLGETRTYPSFEQRIQVFRERVLGRQLTPDEVKSIRAELDFYQAEAIETGEPLARRNAQIIAFARETFPDSCVGCDGEYKILDRSFLMPRNKRPYLEVNHVVAWSSGSHVVDVIDNLVKLCPTCHRALTPNRAEESLQRKIIGRMLSSRSEVLAFVSGLADQETPEDFVFRCLS